MISRIQILLTSIKKRLMPTIANIAQRIALIITGGSSTANLVRPIMSDTLNVATAFYSAATNPGAANDNTQNYRPGSFGYNTATQRYYICRDASTGAAVWELISLDSLYVNFSFASLSTTQFSERTAFVRATATGTIDEAIFELPDVPYLSKTVDIIILGTVTTAINIANAAGAAQFSIDPFTSYACVKMVCTNATTQTWSAVNLNFV
jgi:hypothetical protein